MATVIKKHFIGRDAKFKIAQNINGLSTQASTPSQSSYVEITPIQVDSVSEIDISSFNLHGISGFCDVYDAATHKITRRYGRKVLTGNETYAWGNPSVAFSWPDMPTLDTSARPICTRLQGVDSFTTGDQIITYNATNLLLRMSGITGIQDAKNIIAAAYAEGKPFIVYYPLETPIVEDAPPLIKQCIVSGKRPGVTHTLVYIDKNIFDGTGEAYRGTWNDGVFTSTGTKYSPTYNVSCGFFLNGTRQAVNEMTLQSNNRYSFTFTYNSANCDTITLGWIGTQDEYLRILTKELVNGNTYTVSLKLITAMTTTTNGAIGEIMIEESSIATAYEPYNKVEIPLGNTFTAIGETKTEVTN